MLKLRLSQKQWTTRALAAAAFMLNCQIAQAQNSWGVESQNKVEVIVPESDEIQRSRVTIRKNEVSLKGAPALKRESISFEKALRFKRFEKTQQLIKQLEELIPRERQRGRRGELQMRLAELYFERSKDVASEESESWKKAIEKWEALEPDARSRKQRPVLRTPQADRYRKQALTLYRDLEKRSRGRDLGRSQSIQRDEVLFYLGMTLVDLRQTKAAEKPLEELLKKFPTSQRSFAARLQLADLYFDRASFTQARTLYLGLASDRVFPKLSEELRPYIVYKLAWSYFNTGDYNKAVLAFKRTIELAEDQSSTISYEVEARRDLARAFALAGQYDEGLEFFRRDDELKYLHLQNSSDLAASRGQDDLAIRFIGMLIEEDPEALIAKDYALQRIELYRRHAKKYNFFERFKEYVDDYGAESDWMDAREADQRQLYKEEVVTLMRREAKALHRSAQRRKQDALFRAASVYYALYFDKVPDPNKDSAKNFQEMTFYYAELLYRLKRFEEAEKFYADVKTGRYATNAAYARILALREIIGSDGDRTDDLVDATEDFIKRFPGDPRGSDLLYATAFQAYSSGDREQSAETLRKIIVTAPGSKAGLQAAERLLFVLEREKDFDVAIAGSDELLKNRALMSAHGTSLRRKVTLFKEKIQFKQLESMSESSKSRQQEKSRAFFALAPKLSPSLQERALNNALVLAEKSGEAEIARRSGAVLLQKFPKSEYSRGLYLVEAERLAKQGQWTQSLVSYTKYLTLNKKRKALAKEEYESAMWNRLFIQGHLEGQVGVEVLREKVASKNLQNAIEEFIKNYPRSEFRADVLEMAAFRNRISRATLAQYRALPNLSSRERQILDQSELSIDLRSASNAASKRGLLKAWPAPKANKLPWAHRRVLARWAFEDLQSEYDRYQKFRLNFKGNAFAKTLQTKTQRLEALERSYSNVVAYGDADFALRSLSRLALMYDSFATELAKAPVPAAELSAFISPFKVKTKGLLIDCITKAREFKIAGPGLESCRNALAKVDPGSITLTHEEKLNPGFIGAPSLKGAMWKNAVSASSAKDEGKLLLVLKTARGHSETDAEAKIAVPYIENLVGLNLWREGRTEQAVALFRKLTDISGDDFRELRRVASMNLASIFVKVGDFSAASDLMKGLEQNSEQAALIAGSAAVGEGDFEASRSIYRKAFSKTKRNKFVFHEALSLDKAGKREDAVKAMKRYIDLETPPGSHISRKLLKGWGG